MKAFTYNDMQFRVEPHGGGWDILCLQAQGPAVAAANLFQGATEEEAAAKALALVKTIFPVGVKSVGPDVLHPNAIGDLKIVGPDVQHPNFIYWNKDSVSCPKDL